MKYPRCKDTYGVLSFPYLEAYTYEIPLELHTETVETSQNAATSRNTREENTDKLIKRQFLFTSDKENKSLAHGRKELSHMPSSSHKEKDRQGPTSVGFIEQVSACFEENAKEIKPQQRDTHSAGIFTAQNSTSNTQRPLTFAAKTLQTHVSYKYDVLKKYLARKIEDYVTPRVSSHSGHAVTPCCHCHHVCHRQNYPCCPHSCQNVFQPSPVLFQNHGCPCGSGQCPALYNVTCHHPHKRTVHDIHYWDKKPGVASKKSLKLPTPGYHCLKTTHEEPSHSDESDSTETDWSMFDFDEQTVRTKNFKNNNGDCIENQRKKSNVKFKKTPIRKKQHTTDFKNQTKKSARNRRCAKYELSSDESVISNERIDNVANYGRKDQARNIRNARDRSCRSNYCRQRNPSSELKELWSKQESPFRIYKNASRSGFRYSGSRKHKCKRIFSSKVRQPSCSTHYNPRSKSNVVSWGNISKYKSQGDSGFYESPSHRPKEYRSICDGRLMDNRKDELGYNMARHDDYQDPNEQRKRSQSIYTSQHFINGCGNTVCRRRNMSKKKVIKMKIGSKK